MEKLAEELKRDKEVQIERLKQEVDSLVRENIALKAEISFEVGISFDPKVNSTKF